MKPVAGVLATPGPDRSVELLTQAEAGLALSGCVLLVLAVALAFIRRDIGA